MQFGMQPKYLVSCLLSITDVLSDENNFIVHINVTAVVIVCQIKEQTLSTKACFL